MSTSDDCACGGIGCLACDWYPPKHERFVEAVKLVPTKWVPPPKPEPLDEFLARKIRESDALARGGA